MQTNSHALIRDPAALPARFRCTLRRRPLKTADHSLVLVVLQAIHLHGVALYDAHGVVGHAIGGRREGSLDVGFGCGGSRSGHEAGVARALGHDLCIFISRIHAGSSLNKVVYLRILHLSSTLIKHGIDTGRTLSHRPHILGALDLVERRLSPRLHGFGCLHLLLLLLL